jgi:hypothetical protein
MRLSAVVGAVRLIRVHVGCVVINPGPPHDADVLALGEQGSDYQRWGEWRGMGKWCDESLMFVCIKETTRGYGQVHDM